MAENENLDETTEAASPADAPRSDEPVAAGDDETTRGASSADATPAAAADAGPERAPARQAQVEPPEILAPKERRRRARTAKAAKVPVRSARTSEERHEERVAERRGKATARAAGRVKARAKARAAEHQTAATPPREHVPGQQKVRQGIVTSDKADKTITVRIDLARRHRRYQKIVAKSSTLHAHDESNDAHIGDTVLVRECRPLSRNKRWRLVDVLERAK
jgi:small subunit ribosomal protein S17